MTIILIRSEIWFHIPHYETNKYWNILKRKFIEYGNIDIGLYHSANIDRGRCSRHSDIIPALASQPISVLTPFKEFLPTDPHLLHLGGEWQVNINVLPKD